MLRSPQGRQKTTMSAALNDAMILKNISAEFMLKSLESTFRVFTEEKDKMYQSPTRKQLEDFEMMALLRFHETGRELAEITRFSELQQSFVAMQATDRYVVTILRARKVLQQYRELKEKAKYVESKSVNTIIRTYLIEPCKETMGKKEEELELWDPAFDEIKRQSVLSGADLDKGAKISKRVKTLQESLQKAFNGVHIPSSPSAAELELCKKSAEKYLKGAKANLAELRTLVPLLHSYENRARYYISFDKDENRRREDELKPDFQETAAKAESIIKKYDEFIKEHLQPNTIWSGPTSIQTLLKDLVSKYIQTGVQMRAGFPVDMVHAIGHN